MHMQTCHIHTLLYVVYKLDAYMYRAVLGVYVSLCLCLYVSICTCMCSYMYMCRCTCNYMSYVYVYVNRKGICVYVCIVYMHICLNIYI